MNLRQMLILPVLIIGLFDTSVGQSIANKVIIEGKTTDALTAEEIPYVNIYFLKSYAGTSSDAEGNFSLQITKQHLSDTLVFSAIGYKILKRPISEVLNHPNQTIALEEDILTLGEVTVSAIPAVEIIKRAMNKRKSNYGISPHKLSGIYRITDQEDGAYVRLLEAAVDIYDPNYLKKNSRMVDYLGLRQSKDFRTFKWKVDKLNARNVDELLKPDFIKRPTRATHPNGFEKGFFYAFERYALLDNEQIYIISATKNSAYEWPNYNATFYVRAADFAILRVERDYNIGRPNWAKAPNVTTSITKDQLILKYKEVDGKLYLSYFLWNLKGQVLDAKSEEKIISFERNEELNIHSVSLEEINNSPTLWEGDIYKLVEPYDKKFWESYPISNTKLFKEVKKELEEKQDLNEQFLSSDIKYAAYNPKKTYKPKELREDFLLFQRSLEEGHPSLYRYITTADFSKCFDSTLQHLSKPLTEVEFYRLLTPIIAKINCGHTQSLLSEEYYQFYNHRKFYFPLQIQLLDGKLFVSKHYYSNDTIASGSQILSVNGETIEAIQKTLNKHLPSDGHIQTSKDRLFGQNFSGLYSIYYELRDQFFIKIKKPDGQLINTNLPGISFTDYLSQKEKPNHTNQYDIINAETALLQVGSFADHQGQSFKTWVKNSFEKIRESNIKNLIIDLRDNTGGRDDYALYLYSFLASDSFRYHDYLESATNSYSFLAFTNQDSSLNKLMLKIVQKDAAGRFMLNKTHPTLGVHEDTFPNYSGKVFFLINGNTFSAAADFAAVARQNKRGLFIGEETGGTAIGNASNGELILTLPNTGIRIKIPLFKIVNAINTPEEGRGVIPEHKVIYTNKDIIEKRDKELKLAISIIQKKSKDQ